MDYFDKTKEELVKELLRLQQEINFLKATNAAHINEPESAEKALQESEAKYRGLIENSPDAICIYSEGKIILVNKACLLLVAATLEEELIGKPVMQFVHPDSRELVIERMRRTVTEGVVLPLVEEKFLRLDGCL